jgi:hypothetical protein
MGIIPLLIMEYCESTLANNDKLHMITSEKKIY